MSVTLILGIVGAIIPTGIALLKIVRKIRKWKKRKVDESSKKGLRKVWSPLNIPANPFLSKWTEWIDLGGPFGRMRYTNISKKKTSEVQNLTRTSRFPCGINPGSFFSNLFLFSFRSLHVLFLFESSLLVFVMKTMRKFSPFFLRRFFPFFDWGENPPILILSIS